ncbi:MAG TPA: hypothetical protein VH186_07600 [Chloroflexia bacterium]|nr:hypothetical protein [Chloroflexia bacterium]
MKMFIGKKETQKKNGLRFKALTVGLMVVIMALLLVACGEGTETVTTPGNAASSTPTATNEPATTAAADPTTAEPPTQVATTTQPATAGNPATQPPSGNNPTPITTKASEPSYKPVIRFSSNTVKIGDGLVVSGSGYPAGAKLEVSLIVQNGALVGPYATTKVDSKGNFSSEVKLVSVAGGKTLTAGRVVLRVSTQDNKVAASAPLTLVAPAPAYNPTLGASILSVKLGQEITLLGSGYPANLELDIVGGVQNPNDRYGKVKTDAQGKFSRKVTLPQQNIFPGSYFIYASSADFKYQAKVELNVQAGLLISSATVKIGEEVTLNGSAFPPNTELKIVGGVQNPIALDTVKTDAQGNFTKTVKLNQAGLQPGLFHISATTVDFKYQSTVDLTLN